MDMDVAVDGDGDGDGGGDGEGEGLVVLTSAHLETAALGRSGHWMRA